MKAKKSTIVFADSEEDSDIISDSGSEDTDDSVPATSKQLRPKKQIDYKNIISSEESEVEDDFIGDL